MAHSKREIKPGRAHTKVAGDDEMLRTGFYDGTPLEGGKIADSQPVDLFAAARRVAEADPSSNSQSSQQQQQHKEEPDEQIDGGTTTKSAEAAAAKPAAATETAATERPDGGRRLGLGRPPPV